MNDGSQSRSNMKTNLCSGWFRTIRDRISSVKLPRPSSLSFSKVCVLTAIIIDKYCGRKSSNFIPILRYSFILNILQRTKIKTCQKRANFKRIVGLITSRPIMFFKNHFRAKLLFFQISRYAKKSVKRQNTRSEKELHSILNATIRQKHCKSNDYFSISKNIVRKKRPK